ncbi:MAG: phosphatase PAP2 family protein [Cytophagia bacterium]|nr:phosphatase PAP2 family protein [Cytophagia bacterium]
MKIKIVILILCLAFPFKNLAQKPAKKIRWKAPVALGVASFLLYNSSAKDAQSTIYRNNFSNFSTKLDDILQYTPTILNVGLAASGLKTKNTRADRLGIFVLGTGMYVVATQGLKYAINETRPNGTEHSFPSGHAATAFFGATILAKEYGENYPWIAVGGYAIAGTTAVLRMANNQHWASDVFMGAGIGIASAEIASYLYPKIKTKLFNSKSAWNFEPQIAPNYYVARLNYSF